MKKQLILLLISACFISACSTYKTNSKTTFKSTLLSGQEPVIHVGEITEKPDKLVLLGWVEASVSKPSIISKNPTEEQANIILAEKGQALGADAIIYVTYRTRIGSLLLSKIEARGQAVKLKDNAAQLEGIKPRRTIVQPPISTTDTPIHSSITEQPATTIEPNDLTIDKEISTTDSTEEITYKDINKEEDLPTSIDEVIKIKATSAPKNTAPVSLKSEVALRSKENELLKLSELVKKASHCEPTLHDVTEYESDYDALNYMIMNADFLLKKSRGLKDEDMESASIRLTQLLEQQLDKLKAKKPVLAK